MTGIGKENEARLTNAVIILVVAFVLFYTMGKSGTLNPITTTIASTIPTTITWGSVPTTSIWSTSSTTTQSTTSIVLQSNTLNGTFTYYPASPLKINSVQAVIANYSGQQWLHFVVNYTNIGQSPIYTIYGCGSSMTSNITSGNTVQTKSGGLRCMCMSGLKSMPPGANRTAVDPGCWSSYAYVVTGTGYFTARLNLYWYNSQQYSSSSNVTINSGFTIH